MMIANLKPYSAMKDSGVEWLGKAPEHWDLERGKNLFTKMQRPVQDMDEVVTCFRDGTVTLRKNRRTQGFTESLKEIGYQGIRSGDLVIHAMDAFAGAVGVSDSNGKGTPVYAVCKPTPNANAHYHAAVIQEMARSQWILALATGIRERSTDFRFGTYASQRVPLPPLPEQDAIVRFIGYVDRRIRRYIRAKQKLIKLLEEQKQAIIHQAVTRGLDPDVPLKDPGIEWLGQVPEHWQVTRLKFVAARIVDCLHATPQYSPSGEFPAIRTADISPGAVHLSTARRLQAAEYHRWVERLEPASGDVLYSREGERFGIAACVPPDTRLCISQRMMIFRIRPVHNPLFVMWLLNSPTVYAQANQDVMGSTAPHVNVSTIRNYAFALPPKAEQDCVVRHIEGATSSFSKTIDDANREIELLNEYRTRLISDVVTGKLDVRESAASLPDEAEDSESTEDLDEKIEAEMDQADDQDNHDHHEQEHDDD